MKGGHDKAFKHASNELKESIQAIDKHLEGKKFLVGDSITLADIALVSALHYPMHFSFNNQFRNKVLHLLAWFNSLHESDALKAVLGTAKALTNPLKPPIIKAPKPAAAEKSPDQKKDKKKKKN